jgi:hypothetical protein
MKTTPVALIFIFLCLLEAPPVHAFYQPYPYVLSQLIAVLPQGFVTINVADETFYYSNGIFYQKILREQKYVVVPPPIGAVVFDIPPGYQLMFIDGISYYNYGGVYYKRVLEGYKVIYPPV